MIDNYRPRNVDGDINTPIENKLVPSDPDRRYGEYIHEEIKLLRFINAINKQAKENRGQIIKLIGNHELLNLERRKLSVLRYITELEKEVLTNLHDLKLNWIHIENEHNDKLETIRKRANEAAEVTVDVAAIQQKCNTIEIRLKKFIEEKTRYKQGNVIFIETIRKKFNDFMDTRATKLDNRLFGTVNKDYIIETINVCKSCLKPHIKDCCDKYTRLHRTKRTVVRNIELVKN
ncbi:MAG: hypothetical protein EBX50_11030 [Chitinophagia bacterium]|nr:hypothetical protein [Chitinophagia bacterium]